MTEANTPMTNEEMDKAAVEKIMNDIIETTNELGGAEGMTVLEARYSETPGLFAEAKVQAAVLVSNQIHATEKDTPKEV